MLDGLGKMMHNLGERLGLVQKNQTATNTQIRTRTAANTSINNPSSTTTTAPSLKGKGVTTSSTSPATASTEKVSKGFFSKLFAPLAPDHMQPPKEKTVKAFDARLDEVDSDIDFCYQDIENSKEEGDVATPRGISSSQSLFRSANNELAEKANELRMLLRNLYALQQNPDSEDPAQINQAIERAQGKLNQVLQRLDESRFSGHKNYVGHAVLEKVVTNARDTSLLPAAPAPAPSTATAAPTKKPGRALTIINKLLKSTQPIKVTDYADLSHAIAKLESMKAKLVENPASGYLTSQGKPTTADAKGIVGTSGLTPSQIVKVSDLDKAIGFLKNEQEKLEAKMDETSFFTRTSIRSEYAHKADKLIAALKKNIDNFDNSSEASAKKIAQNLADVRKLVDELRNMPSNTELLANIKNDLPDMDSLKLTAQARRDYNHIKAAPMLAIIDKYEAQLLLTTDDQKVFDEVKEKIINEEPLTADEYRFLLNIRNKLLPAPESKDLIDLSGSPKAPVTPPIVIVTNDQEEIGAFFDRAKLHVIVRNENSEKTKQARALVDALFLTDKNLVTQFINKIVNGESFTSEEYAQLVKIRLDLKKLAEQQSNHATQSQINNLISFLKTPNERKMDAFEGYLLDQDGKPARLDEGIFRLSGSTTEIAGFKEKMDIVDFTSFKNEDESYKTRDQNIVTGLMKDFLRNFNFFPENGALYNEYLAACKNYSEADNDTAEEAAGKKMEAAIEKLPPENKALFLQTVKIAKAYAAPDPSTTTKMDANNLAIVLGPNFVRDKSNIQQEASDIGPLTAGFRFLIEPKT